LKQEIKQHKQSMGNGPKIDIHKENGKIIAKIGTAEANSIYHVIFRAFDKSHLTKIKLGKNQGKPWLIPAWSGNTTC
jgi:hypothetical protein